MLEGNGRYFCAGGIGALTVVILAAITDWGLWFLPVAIALAMGPVLAVMCLDEGFDLRKKRRDEKVIEYCDKSKVDEQCGSECELLVEGRCRLHPFCQCCAFLDDCLADTCAGKSDRQCKVVGPFVPVKL